MAIPDYQTLMLPVLREAAKGEIRVRDCVEKIAGELGLVDDEISEMLPSGRQTIFANRVHWAKSYMIHANLVVATRRGHFQATERGMQMLAANPDRIDNTVLSEFPEFVAWKGAVARTSRRQKDGGKGQPVLPAPFLSEDQTPTELMEAAFQDLQAELLSDVLARVRAASPAFFEQLVVDLLVSMGYGGSRTEAGQAIGRSGDEGIDGIIKEDALGLEIVYVQAKRWQEGANVGRPDVQGFAGSLDGFGATKGIFVTTSDFAKTAREYVDRITKRIILINGDELARLMIEHNVGIRMTQSFELKRVDEDYFGED
jgi:restriction system protein